MSDVAFVWNPNHLDHAAPGHVERPERVEASLALLRDAGLLDRVERLLPRAATDEELSWVHERAYVAAVDDACERGGGWADADTYLTPKSCEAARYAAGATIEAAEAVLSGGVRAAFAAARPPGHHARPAQAMGFCLLNNVAVAARHARERHGLERVAIVDIDVHHGNGTQDAFYDDGGVLYVSTHQSPFYPGTGRMQETGEGLGAGTNVNIPLPAGCGDAEYAAAFEQVIEPVVRRYAPQLLLVSCGFDAHFADALAGMTLSNAGYAGLISGLRTLADELCSGRTVIVLEGGYDLDAVAWGVRNALEVLLGEDVSPDPHGTLGHGPTVNIDGLLADVRGYTGLR